MRASEIKRQVGYADLLIKECCGTCMNCVERGKHLRCGKHGFAVTKFGICRNGYKFNQGTRAREFSFGIDPAKDGGTEVTAIKLLEYHPEDGE